MSTVERSITRRNVLSLAAVGIAASPSLVHACGKESLTSDATANHVETESDLPRDTIAKEPIRVQYLEIVTADVNATCELYSQMYDATFAEPDHNLGGARTAKLATGGLMGIRAPLHSGENPVTRAYVLVKDIEAAVAQAKESGAEIAVPPMKIPGHGTCAIYLRGGIEAGLWQL